MAMASASWVVVLLPSALLTGVPEFHAPLVLPLSMSHITEVAAGDLNGDGKLDLVIAGSGYDIVALVQDRLERDIWTEHSSRAGYPPWHLEVGDFDGDGFDDVVSSSYDSSFFLRGVGDGRFKPPVRIPETFSSTGIESADWDLDGRLDLAVATNVNLGGELSILLGPGDGTFLLAEQHAVWGFHIAGMDFDANGTQDLLLKNGLGFIALRGADGFFEPLPLARFVDCDNAFAVGDLNGDRRDDAVIHCIDPGSNISAGSVVFLSNGDGTFRRSFAVDTPGSAPPLIEDFDLDASPDVVTTNFATSMLLLHPGLGDGTLGAPIVFGPTGPWVRSILAADLDGDGTRDLVAGGGESGETVTILWGTDKPLLFESGRIVRGYRATSFATPDMDRDGELDLVCNRAGDSGFDVFLAPLTKGPERPSATLPTSEEYETLISADLDGNGVPDVAGTNGASDEVLVTLLDANGAALGEDAYAMDAPSAISVAGLHGDESPDIVALSRGSGQLAILQGRGQGRFLPARMQSTLALPKDMAVGDLDADGKSDVVVMAAFGAVVHFGGDDATLGEGSKLLEAGREVTHVLCGDLTGDGVDDVLLNQKTPSRFLIVEGNRSRQFGDPKPIAIPSHAVALGLEDVDGDGMVDIHYVDSIQKSVILLGPSFLEKREMALHLETPKPLEQIVRDFDGDGVLDLAVLESEISYFFRGEPGGPRMLRGDLDASGTVNMTDAVALLVHLFQQGPIECSDAADSNDDGILGITDAIVTLRWLFQGEAPPADPGPLTCGPDRTPDELGDCRTCSR